MAHQQLFASRRGPHVAPSNTINDAGGAAYERSAESALALYALTGTFNSTFYADASTHLDRVTELCGKVDPRFIAQLAVVSRERGFMKDLPAYLLASLAMRDVKLCAAVFPRVIDNAKMLRNFVQIVRSGVIGRKSLGSAPKRLVTQWLAARPVETLFRQSTGTDPSLADVVKMVHPKPRDQKESAFYGWLIGKKFDFSALPDIIQHFEGFKKGTIKEIPDVPFEMLTALELDKAAWTSIAKRATWTQTRMNLNTFQRHGVFEDLTVIEEIAQRLSDPDQVRKAKVFPYQLLAAFLNVSSDVPMGIKLALQQAMEVAVENVPSIEGNVYVMPDVSGSMQSPVTGSRKGATSKVRCVDVAALVTAAILRKNPRAKVIPFEGTIIPEGRVGLNPLDSIMTNAGKLAALGGGSTNCSAPLAAINWHKWPVDVAVFVSDNESWVDNRRGFGGTGVMQEWAAIKARCPKARLVCIDLTPSITTQVTERPDILQVGGFSDQVFDVLSEFAAGGMGGDRIVAHVKEVLI